MGGRFKQKNWSNAWSKKELQRPISTRKTRKAKLFGSRIFVGEK
jgi:hypothetical protein